MAANDLSNATRITRQAVRGPAVSTVIAALGLTAIFSLGPASAATPAMTASAPPVTAAAAASPVVAPASVADPSVDWMQDLLSQVDPTGIGHWTFERNGAWGASDGINVFIDPAVPADKRLSVMVHEYSHLLQARVFGSLDASVAALGGTGNNESVADCMAQLQGATWVHYGCRDDLRAAAAAILAGNRP